MSVSQSKDEGTSFEKESSMMVDMLLDDDDDDDIPDKLHTYVFGENLQPPSTTASNAVYVFSEFGLVCCVELYYSCTWHTSADCPDCILLADKLPSYHLDIPKYDNGHFQKWKMDYFI